MGSTTDKIKGAANEAAGAVKQGVGEAVGNPNLQGRRRRRRSSRAKLRRPSAKPRMRSRRSSTRPDLEFIPRGKSGPFGSLFSITASESKGVGEQSWRVLWK